MTPKDQKLAYRIYLYLGALFITSLVVSNLIFPKILLLESVSGSLTVFGVSLFEISVGILPYPYHLFDYRPDFRNLRA